MEAFHELVFTNHHTVVDMAQPQGMSKREKKTYYTYYYISYHLTEY